MKTKEEKDMIRKDKMDPVVKMLVDKYTNEYVNLVQQFEWHIKKINDSMEVLNKEVDEFKAKQAPALKEVRDKQEFVCESISDLQDQWMERIRITVSQDDMMSKEMQELMMSIGDRLKSHPGCLHISSQIATLKMQGGFVPDEPEVDTGAGTGSGNGNAIRVICPGDMVNDEIVKS